MPDTDTTTVFDVTSDAFSVRRNVLESAAHIAHASIDPFGLLRVGFEDVVDFADREEASHFVEVRSYAADDAYVNCIGRTDVADTFGFGEELGELVGTSNSASSGAEGEKLSFNHDGL
jgi:hypothetical protein